MRVKIPILKALSIPTALLLAVGISFAQGKPAFRPANPAVWQLTANQPARDWTVGYPVGNGTLGGLNLGGFPAETIYLNHITIWSRPAHVELKENDRKAGMDEAFALALKGDYAAAQNVYLQTKHRGNSVADYQGLGALKIEHVSAPGTQVETKRKLDLLSGESIAVTGTVTETLLASHPDRCIAVRLESTADLNFKLTFARERDAGITKSEANRDSLVLEGDTGLGGKTGGTKFRAIVKPIAERGVRIKAEDKALVISGGKAVTLFVCVSTDYNREEPRNSRTDNWAAEADRDMAKVVSKGWAKVRAAAAADHAQLMAGCDVDLGRSEPEVSKLTTPERMALLRKGGHDPELVATFFQFGRHLFIGSSRNGSLPPNLQGLWEPGLHAAWNGDYHLNINVQMNHWLAGPTNLASISEPYIHLIQLLHKHGQATAKSLGCRGYCANLASDAWGLSDWGPGPAEWAAYVMGAHWAQEYLMEYYRFSGDKKYLKEIAWPILKDGSLFMLDWLRECPADGPYPGKLIAPVDGSPENAFTYKDKDGKDRGCNTCLANTHQHMVAWETFSDTLEAAKILGISDDFTKQVKAALARVPAPPIGEDGRIMEFCKPFGEVWKGHRHKSHLYGMYPGYQISMTKTPELAQAVNKSLEVRMDPKNGDCGGGGHTGWNLAWSTNLYARLLNGERALAMLEEQMARQVNDNLFNRCGGPFQIDGNLGSPAGVAEMLMQSHEGEISLLPALPPAWAKEGSFKGLCARGGYIVDCAWKDGKVVNFSIKAGKNTPAGSAKVRVNGEAKTVAVKK